MSDLEVFVPSRHGFAFTNSWPSEPAVVLKTPFGNINVGNASAGLCGGMVFAALDYWHKEISPPTARPAQGTPLFKYIVRRLVDSWHVPAGVAQYYQWMNLPDADSSFKVMGRRVITERGLAWRTIKAQWSQIKLDLDRGISEGERSRSQSPGPLLRIRRRGARIHSPGVRPQLRPARRRRHHLRCQRSGAPHALLPHPSNRRTRPRLLPDRLHARVAASGLTRRPPPEASLPQMLIPA